MIEGHIILHAGVTASFGKLEQKADDGADVYATTFTSPEGLTATVLWSAESAREYFTAALDSLSPVIALPKPKLILPGVG